MRWNKVGEVESECTLHNSIVLAIFVPKIIKVNGNLTKFWRKQFWLFFLDIVYIAQYYAKHLCCTVCVIWIYNAWSILKLLLIILYSSTSAVSNSFKILHGVYDRAVLQIWCESCTPVGRGQGHMVSGTAAVVREFLPWEPAWPRVIPDL